MRWTLGDTSGFDNCLAYDAIRRERFKRSFQKSLWKPAGLTLTAGSFFLSSYFFFLLSLTHQPRHFCQTELRNIPLLCFFPSLCPHSNLWYFSCSKFISFLETVPEAQTSTTVHHSWERSGILVPFNLPLLYQTKRLLWCLMGHWV